MLAKYAENKQPLANSQTLNKFSAPPRFDTTNILKNLQSELGHRPNQMKSPIQYIFAFA